MPLLRSLFQKDISRYIETVIKADDSEHLIDEMNEYVLTSEVAGKVVDVFENYSETGLGGSQADGPNGCWISGFFGSGKSHLLKMISYTLENRELKGQKLGELFLNKVKEQKDPKLAADVEKSLRIPWVSQKHLESEFAKSLLKILFLVKYTVTFKATSQNLSVLMIPKLDTDLEVHEKKIQEALNILESQTYIKRSGDGYYEFLTSEEKDIQTEINQTSVSHPEIRHWIADVIFKDIMGGYKIRSEDLYC